MLKWTQHLDLETEEKAQLLYGSSDIVQHWSTAPHALLITCLHDKVQSWSESSDIASTAHSVSGPALAAKRETLRAQEEFMTALYLWRVAFSKAQKSLAAAREGRSKAATAASMRQK